MKILYGVLFWEEIYYSKVPYVWQSAYQFGPLDFYDGDFYLARKKVIEDKLEKLENMTRFQIKQYFLAEYEKHKNIHNLIVNWDHQKLN